VLGTEDDVADDAGEDIREDAPEAVVEREDEDEPERMNVSDDDGNGTELAACDDELDGAASDADSTDEVAVTDEIDGSAELDTTALVPTDWFETTEADDSAALLPDDTEAKEDDCVCTKDVTDDEGAELVGASEAADAEGVNSLTNVSDRTALVASALCDDIAAVLNWADVAFSSDFSEFAAGKSGAVTATAEDLSPEEDWSAFEGFTKLPKGFTPAP